MAFPLYRQRCCSVIRAPCHPPRAPMEMTATAVLTMAARPVPHLAGLARGSLNLAVLVKRCGCGCCSRACRCFVPRFPTRSIPSLAAHMRPDTYVRTRTTAHTCPRTRVFAHTHISHARPRTPVRTRVSAHVCAHTHIRTHASVHACPHAQVSYTRLHARVHTHTSALTLPYFLGA